MQSVSCLAASQAEGCSLNVFSYNAVQNGYAISSGWKLAALLMSDMRGRVTEPDSVSFNTMLAAWKPSGEWAKSLYLLPFVDGFGLASIAGSCAAAGQWRSAIVSLEYMEVGRYGRYGCIGAIECNAVLNACADATAWEACLSLLCRVLQAGPEPTLVTLGCVAKALAGKNCLSAWVLPLLLVTTCQQSGITGTAKKLSRDASKLNVFLGSCNVALAGSSHWQLGTALLAPLILEKLRFV